MQHKIDSNVLTITNKQTKAVHARYRLFVRSDGQKLVFYPAPKNANTSFKDLLARHVGVDDQLQFLDDEISGSDTEEVEKNLHPDKHMLWNFLPTKPAFTKLPASAATIKLAVVRDPIKRFFSAYKNRILWHKDKEFGGLSPMAIADHLLKGRVDNGHFQQQVHFLGPEPSYFTKVALMPDFGPVVEEISEFFGKKLELKRMQTRNGDLDPAIEKDPELLTKLNQFYAPDYAFIDKMQR